MQRIFMLVRAVFVFACLMLSTHLSAQLSGPGAANAAPNTN